jgi:hypothetical protein
MKLSPNQLADKMIKELAEAGISYDEMVPIFRKAKELYLELEARKNKTKNK